MPMSGGGTERQVALIVDFGARVLCATPSYALAIAEVAEQQGVDLKQKSRLAFGLFGASVLLYSQAATTRALMPLGIALGIPPQFLIAMFPSVNGYFFIPTYGSLIAAINFDLSGTTKIGKYVLNHSFMIPGVVATGVAVITGLFLARIMF